MAEEAKTQKASSGDKVADNPELAKLEQAVSKEAVSEDPPQSDPQKQPTDDAPLGQAFQELAEKKGFKSVDDLVQAYEHSESQSTRTNQQLSDLSKEVKSLKTPQGEDDSMKDLPPEQRQALDLLGKVIDERLDTKIRPLIQQKEVQEAQQEIGRVREAYPSVNDAQLEQAVGVVEKHPTLSLDEAIRIVTYGEKQVAVKAKAGKTEKTQQKSRAFVESARGSKTGTDIDYSKLSLKELENILPKHGQYIDSEGTLRRD